MNKAAKPDIGPSFYFINLGCPKNLVDAECVADALILWGFTESPDPESADLIVITTCSFIKAAMEESVDEILAAASALDEEQTLAVLGCLVSREGSRLNELLPEVDIFLPVSEMKRLPSLLYERGIFSGIEPPSKSLDIRAEKLFTPDHIAYLKVAEGCRNRCAYCLIPAIRGNLVSRSKQEILKEAVLLAKRGVRELVIIAQDTGSWGMDAGSKADIFELLDEISKNTVTPWVRLMYLHPSNVAVEKLEDLLNERKIVRYLDLPIQHASDRILKSMRRGYDGEYLKRLFDRLKGRFDDLVLRTTVMVGFPGETEEDFSELVDFLERYEIDHVGVFEYSEERGTRAYEYPGKVDKETVLQRKDMIMDIQMDIFTDHFVKRVGDCEKVLVDELIPAFSGPSANVWGSGRFYGQAYEVDGVVFISGKKARAGEFVKVKFEQVQGYDIFGSVI